MAMYKRTITVLKGHNKLVSHIDDICEKNKIEDVDINDFVHDIADYYGTEAANRTTDSRAEDVIDRWSMKASDINNQGRDSQIRTILAFHGIDAGIKLLNEYIQDVRKKGQLLLIDKEAGTKRKLSPKKN